MRTVNIKANPGSRTLLFSVGFNHLQILQNNRLETRPWGFVEMMTFSLHCLSMQAMQAEPTGSPGGSQIAFPLETHTVFPVFCFFFFLNSPRSCNLLQKANIWILMVKRMSPPHQNKELESVINIPLFWTPTSKLWSELSSSSHSHLFLLLPWISVLWRLGEIYTSKYSLPDHKLEHRSSRGSRF